MKFGIKLSADSKGLGMAQAKVMRANGQVEWHYSKPTIPIFSLKAWRWYINERIMFRRERQLYAKTNQSN